MRWYAAPLQGITTWIYRRAHARAFGGADRYYMPFVSPVREHIFTPRELRDLTPEHNAGVCAVPQIMTCRAEDFLWAAGELAAMGYGEVNLNLGCPSGTVTAKGKGAGFLARPAELDWFLDRVFAGAPAGLRISVKTRLGVRDEAEFGPLLDIFNDYPLSELILHPRVREDFYKRPVRPEAFAAALPRCRMPVCYNGDLVTAADCAALAERYPALPAGMLGRGAVADPALFRKLRGGAPAERGELERFLADLFDAYSRAYAAPGPAVQRMKEHWYYLIRLFDGGQRLGGRMRRVSSPADYAALEGEILRTLPLRTDALGPL
jgi:tRNA-dihydrouridine synthase